VKDADKLWRFTPEGFSIDAKRFEIDPRKYWGMMQQFKDQPSYFFTNLARELAAEELKKVENQILS